MKIKLDENLPASAAVHLTEAGHDVSTVVDEDLVGANDRDVASAAQAEGRIVVTLDRGFGDLRAYPPGTHPGIIVLHLHDQGAAHVLRALRRLTDEVDLASLAGCIAILEEERLRVRPPSPSGP
ncbi:MAG TPA: DUF5615 family PIN-like protein [Actinomycetota bacterium]|nr:DUF5615 family PIN-like protein [Actinomycetota bacterium]